ncbi:MAG TPA: PD-(D/E)XK nuclease family protein [Bryobacteraceae bacterium]|nr:PD-(D/E)XK nuclease family protein [Bryobacteraceae bacterium]
MRFVHKDLLDWLDAGATVLTPTPLLAAVIENQHTRRQLKNGLRTWPRPSVLAVSAWLRQMWQQARYRHGDEVPALLSPAQEILLWQECIEQSGVPLLDPHSTAVAARDAASRMAAWRAPLAHPAWSETEDAQVFLDWHEHVHRRCREQGWITVDELWLRSFNRPGPMPLPGKVVFAGFSECPPALKELAANLRNSGVSVQFESSQAGTSTLVAVCCGEWALEIDSAARWARSALDSRPDASIGILVPGLRQYRAEVERALRNVFQPASVVQPLTTIAPGNESIIHVHCGKPLSDHPIVASAFLFFDFAEPRIPLASINGLLLSPFVVGGQSERRLRANADASIRRLHELDLPLSAVRKHTFECPELSRRWPKVQNVLGTFVARAGASDWAAFAVRLLEAVGWPGEQPLSALEEAALQQWKQILSTFSSLNLLDHAMTWQEARSHLRWLAAADGPVPGDLTSPVQVIDTSGVQALRFDRVWAAGLSDAGWPPASASTAFIPLALQRLCEMPGATPQSRREQIRQAAKSICEAGDIVFGSYSSGAQESAALSPLFTDIQHLSPDRIDLWQGKPLIDTVISLELETLEDSQAPPLAAHVPVSGGTQLIKSQSACPFQAFARWRLQAEPLEEATFSFDPLDRGIFLHAALACVWQEIKTFAALRSMSPSELAAAIDRAVDQAVGSDRVATVFREQLRLAERQRLKAILEAWLTIETNRTVDFTVETTEHQSHYELGPLRLRLRLDRIDRLKDGRLVLIDYKSGEPKAKSLDGDRPSEPQLLVYAASLGSAVDALYFAKLKPRQEGAVGYGRQAHFGRKNEVPEEDWANCLKEWKNTVEKLGREFVQGYAAVDPQAKACDWCSIKPVCRVREAREFETTEEGE